MRPVFPNDYRKHCGCVHSAQNLRLLLIWSVALVGIFILKAGMNYFVQYYGHCVGVHMQADMRREIFKHMQKLPFSYFDTHKDRHDYVRIVNDLMDVTELAHHGPENIFISVIMLIGSFIIPLQHSIFGSQSPFLH